LRRTDTAVERYDSLPFDVAAGAALGLVCAALAAVLAPTIVPGALRIAEPIYRRAFAPFIRRGWVAD
jgi:hypothetical protein